MKRTVRNICLVLIIAALTSFTAGCARNGSITLSNEDKSVIQNYLDEKLMKPSFDGKVFSAYKVLGSDNNKIYVWALLQEYYKTGDKIEKGTGWSVPLVLNIKKGANGLEIIDYKHPGDGSDYGDDIKALFPKMVQFQIFNLPSTPQEINELEDTAKDRAQKWASL